MFTIGCQVVFSLIQWSGRIRAKFHVHRATWDSSRGRSTSSKRLSRSLVCFSKQFDSLHNSHTKVPQPRPDKSDRFRLLRFRSPLLTESLRFLFLRLLRCFTSAGFAPTDYEFIRRSPGNPGWVAPFGNSWINACLQLPMTYRSLPRPSSPPDTKAFTACP